MKITIKVGEKKYNIEGHRLCGNKLDGLKLKRGYNKCPSCGQRVRKEKLKDIEDQKYFQE